jgi:hypothetical protein
MRLGTIIAVVTLAVGLVVGGCGRSACKDICEGCNSSDEDQCVDECVDDYYDGDGDCKEAIRDLADCVEDDGCESCGSEALEVAGNC